MDNVIKCFRTKIVGRIASAPSSWCIFFMIFKLNKDGFG